VVIGLKKIRMKKVEIKILGTGHEITRSKFTCEEIKKVREYCLENDEDMESVLTNDLEEVLEDRGQWWDCDDLGHFMGGNLNCKIYVSVDDEEYEFDSVDVKTETKSKDHPIFEEGVMVSFITWEKGTMDTYEFEIDDSENFDVNKLKLVVNQIETTDSIYDLIQELYYDGEPLNGDGFSDTDGKAFEVEIEECDEDE
tara:strand:- start:339 stop:932 length:594 start_codon:yes stop_codon:yes gene_type:complete